MAVDVPVCQLYFMQIERAIMVNAEIDVVILSGDALDDDVLEVPISDGLVHSTEFLSIAGRLKKQNHRGLHQVPSRVAPTRP